VERQDLPVQSPSRDVEQEVGNGSLPSFTQRPTTSLLATMQTSLSQSTPPKEPRRFHLSRDNALSLPQSGARVRGSKSPIAVFIERKKVSRPVKEMPNAAVPRDLRKPDSLPNVIPEPATTSSDHPAPLRNVALPSGKIIPWNASPDTLAAEMEAYTLGEIGRNIAKSTPTPVVSTKTGYKSSSRFDPRASLRRPNRPSLINPASELTHENTNDEAMTDATETREEDSNYIIDTYVRMPAEMFESSEQAQNIGLLVLETQPDVDEFYNEYSDNDSDNYDEDEEDENGTPSKATAYVGKLTSSS
jgi:Transcription factor Iwr1